MKPRLDTRFTMAREVHARRFHDELVVLDLARGEYFSLDEVGARVWDELVAGRCLGELLPALATEYAVAEARLAADVLPFVEQLVERGLLATRD